MRSLPPVLVRLMLVAFLLFSSTGCDVDFDEDLEIVSNILPDGTVGVGYAVEIETDGDADVFRLVSGNLPPGLSLTDEGKISGTPVTAGTFVFTVEVLDIFDGFIDQSVSKGFAIVIHK